MGQADPLHSGQKWTIFRSHQRQNALAPRYMIRRIKEASLARPSASLAPLKLKIWTPILNVEFLHYRLRKRYQTWSSSLPFCNSTGKRMGSTQKYSLKWNDFSVNVASTFRDLHCRHDFVDVTLACADGSTLEAHKVILSSVSSYFRDILKVSLRHHYA